MKIQFLDPTLESFLKQSISNSLKSYYDFQQQRIAFGHRVCKLYKKCLGIVENIVNSEEDFSAIDKENTKILTKLRSEYKRIIDLNPTIKTTNIFQLQQILQDNTIIPNYSVFQLLDFYEDFLISEKTAYLKLSDIISQFPIYEQFYKNIVGIGPIYAGLFICYVDPHKMIYASNLLSYCGINPVLMDRYNNPDNRAVTRSEEHFKKKTTVNKAGESIEFYGLPYNKRLHDKILGCMAPQLIKQNLLANIMYHNYKHRLETDISRQKVYVWYNGEIHLKDIYGNLETINYDDNVHKNAVKQMKKNKSLELKQYPSIRISNMGRRYVAKFLCQIIYEGVRQFHGLEVIDLWQESKQNLKKHFTVKPHPELGLTIYDARTGELANQSLQKMTDSDLLDFPADVAEKKLKAKKEKGAVKRKKKGTTNIDISPTILQNDDSGLIDLESYSAYNEVNNNG